MTAQRVARWVVAILAASVTASIVAMSGLAGLGYAVVFGLAVAPGIPAGLALFGDRHPASWITGALIGYVLTAFALWAVIAIGLSSPFAFAGAWAIVLAGSWAIFRGLPRPLAVLPRWRSRDTTALALVLLLVPALMTLPYAHTGARDASGNRYYRAYFTADFVWHAALTAELGRFTMPPQNPYLAGTPIHYYWTYFLLPASVAHAGPGPLRDVERALKVNATATALLFVAAIFFAAWAAVPRAGPAAAAVGLAVVASSAEGLYALLRFRAHGVALSELRNVNVDALTAWDFQGLRVDGLVRCFWWVPQHSMAYALGLVALVPVIGAGSTLPMPVIVISGLALAGSVACNPLVGGIFALTFGIAVAIDAWRAGAFWSRVVRHLTAAIPVGLAIAWCYAADMVEGAGSALQFGWMGAARHAPITTFLLSLGPAVIPAIVGLIVASVVARRTLTAPIVLAVVSIGLLYAVRLKVDTSWVGFRAGQMLLVALPPIVARGLVARRGAARMTAIGVAVLALLAGLPTTVIDTYNAQDIKNNAAGPGFHWTIRLTPGEQDALRWIRRSTPPTAIVQMDPIARGRETWSLIPSFGERRMAAGLPISLLDVPDYHDRSARVRTLFATTNTREAWDIARTLRIDFVYVGGAERAAYPEGVTKFEGSPDFVRAFHNQDVTIYKVQ